MNLEIISDFYCELLTLQVSIVLNYWLLLQCPKRFFSHLMVQVILVLNVKQSFPIQLGELLQIRSIYNLAALLTPKNRDIEM